MVRKIQAKLVLRLHGQGLSGRAIARSQGMSRRSVADVLDAAKAAGIGWDDVANRPDDEVYALLFPGRGERESVYEQPDWGKVHRELARVGVTLRILHGEYVDECRQSGRPHMGYDRFCKLYAAYVARLGVTSRVEHKAGRTIEVDWAGKTMRIVDPVTGDSSTVYLFVAVLPFSRYAFVEPTLDMGQNSWLRAHVAMYEWFGGSTPRLVCDNLKTGVIKHPREGEIVLNDAYRGMAEHYSAAVLPGRVRKPKDKPSAENTVWHVTMALVGAMRDHEFGSLDELRAAIRAWLAEYNSRAFQKRDGSRSSVFKSEEKPLLITLPLMPYEVADWVYGRRVQANSHVAYARNWYSVPYAYIGSTVDLRIGASMLEVWHGEHAVVLAPAPAGDGIQPVVHERVRPARQSRVETMGQETLRAMGPANRPRLRRRDRQAVRHGTPRRASCGCRNAIPPNVWRTRVRCRCGRSLRRGIRTSDRSSNPARTPRAGSPTAPLTTSDGCAAAITTRTWEGGRAMIIDTETKRKLREMNASDLLDAFERLDERTTAPMSHTEVVRLAVDNAHSGHMDAKIQRLVKRAGLRYPPPGGPENHRPGGGTQARPERDRRSRRRELSGTTVERRVPGSHGIGQIPPAMRVGEIRVPGTVPRSLRPNARPGRAGDGRVEQARRSAQARAQIRHLQPARDRRMARRQARRTIQTIPPGAHGAPVRHRQHGVRHAAGDQGMAPTARRRHHRRHDSRPHRAQRDLD